MSKVTLMCLLLIVIALPCFSQYSEVWEYEVVDPYSLYVIGIGNTDNDIQPEIVYVDYQVTSRDQYYIWILDTQTGLIEWQSDMFYHIFTEPEHAPKLIINSTDNMNKILILAQIESDLPPVWMLISYDTSSAGIGVGSYTTKLMTKLNQNSPNPMSKQTKIEFELTSPQSTKIKIYNSAGAIVRTIDFGDKGIGKYFINWNGTDDMGKKLPAGNYFYVLDTKDARLMKKAIIIE